MTGGVWFVPTHAQYRYLLITVPLNIAFAIEVEFGTAVWFFDDFVDLYFIWWVGRPVAAVAIADVCVSLCLRSSVDVSPCWSGYRSDIFFNFRTPYYDKNGLLEIRFRMIAYNYLKSWFFLDFATCLPISYAMMRAFACPATAWNASVSPFVSVATDIFARALVPAAFMCATSLPPLSSSPSPQ